MIAIKLNLGNHLENFIKQQIESGRYKSENELISASLLLLERDEKASLNKLNQLLKDGEDSGYNLPFDNEDFKLVMRQKFVKNEL